MDANRSAPEWSYPALLATIGRAQRPGRAALRRLVRRLRREIGGEEEEPARQRQWIRRAVIAALNPDEAVKAHRL